MSGLPWVATAPTPESAESYLWNLDKRLLALEREYQGPARGPFSNFAVRTGNEKPVVPDGASVYVVNEDNWYLRTGGVWVLYGT